MEELPLPIVSFGKYKDKSVLKLLEDKKYVEWLKQQSWFSDKKEIYNIVFHQTIHPINNSKTPEHNKLQNNFLEKSNQEKLLSKTCKIILPDNINNLVADEEIKRCFCITTIPEFTNNLDKTTIMFEDNFNWDLVLYYKDYQDYYITSKLETELIDKEKYKEQYDIKQKQIHLNKLQKYDELIKIRESIDKEETENFESEFKIYKEQNENNVKEVNKYENELQKYNEKKIDYMYKNLKEICYELRIGLSYKLDEEHHKKITRYMRYNKENKKCIDSLISYSQFDETNNKEKELERYKIIISEKLNKIMNAWDNSNLHLIPNEIKRMCRPIPFIVNERLSYHHTEKYKDVIKCYDDVDGRDSVNNLKKSKKIYEDNYEKNYEKKFNEHYNIYRLQYYEDIVKKHCKSNVYIEKENDNQYAIDITICHYEYAVCCELKPTLSDDYPNVLRKLKTQIELTKNDNRTKFKNFKKKYILILGSFTSAHCSKKQLIEIFKQSNIKIIFTDEIFETLKSEEIKYVNITTNSKKVLFENKLIEENKYLADNLLQTQQKLLQAEEKIKQLEEMLSLKTKKNYKKTIKDDFGN